MSTQSKPKISKTCRIRIKNGSIYCSNTVLNDVKHLLLRLDNVWGIKAGEYINFQSAIMTLAGSKPDHFPGSSLAIIEGWKGY